MFKVLIIVRSTGSNGVSVKSHIVEFSCIREADEAVKSVKELDGNSNLIIVYAKILNPTTGGIYTSTK